LRKGAENEPDFGEDKPRQMAFDIKMTSIGHDRISLTYCLLKGRGGGGLVCTSTSRIYPWSSFSRIWQQTKWYFGSRRRKPPTMRNPPTKEFGFGMAYSGPIWSIAAHVTD
jgi:hypothetical protein